MSAPIAATSPSSNAQPHYRARVDYENGMLRVRADNSSLNQILRDISQQTGMKIVGGVADQRIFGVYGPAPAGTVLQTLLDGTGTNLLLKETPEHAPLELVLTPRTGGVTPPGPVSPGYDATETEPELPLAASPSTGQNRGPVRAPAAVMANPASPSTPPSMPQPANNVMGSPNSVSPTVSSLPSPKSISLDPTPAQSSAPAATSPSTTPPTASQTTTQASPNGVKTPQQIYQELLQMQQKAGQQGNSQGSSKSH